MPETMRRTSSNATSARISPASCARVKSGRLASNIAARHALNICESLFSASFIAIFVAT